MKTLFQPGSMAAAVALVASATLCGIAAHAQVAHPGTSVLMVAPPTPDADALAAQMRILAADPKNADALIKAGELTLKLGDPTAAAVLFTRAEAVRPRDGRLKADEAAVLVHLERPGEALRLFQQAEALGADMADFAAERGLAYDLIGQNDRAQRDYRTALARKPDDAEVMRRYALSLGISGKREQALAEIDPLVRRQDHAGWRDRAFILAMTGAPDEADKIGHAMLPASMADGLSPFFSRLPQLSAVDRAFAVHFGEVAPTAERIADARLIPPLPALTPETRSAPVEVAAATPVAETRAQRRAREKAERAAAKAQRQQMLKPGRTPTPAPTPAPMVAASKPIPVQVKPVVTPAPTSVAAPVVVGRSLSPTMVQVTPTPTPMPAPVVVAQASPVTPAPTMTSATSVARDAATPTASRPAASSSPAVAAPVTIAAPPPTPQTTIPPVAVASAAPKPAPEVRPSPRVGEEDDILRRIMAGISVPSSELGVASPVTAAAPQIASVPALDPAAEAAKTAAAKKATADKASADAKAEADRKAQEQADRKARIEADRKAAAAKKVADAKKAADAKAAADKAAKAKEEKANPSRIFVQVAGGANEDDLPKAWAAVKAKAPDLFKGKQGWSTPLRATNRVLAGPFKTDDEAQEFINALKKKGLSGFSFTSAKGQQVDKLPTK